MAVLEFSEVHTRRHALREDAGATTATKDAAARSMHGKTVHAVGVVEDVIGRDNALIVLFAVEGEVLTCPLERAHGRSMEETIAQVASWRKADRVSVSGKLNWPTFQAEFSIGITTVENGDGSEPEPGVRPGS